MILAGISIFALKNTGLFDKSNIAKEKTEYATAKETIEMEIMQISADCYGNNKDFNIQELAKQMKTANNIIIEKYYNQKTSSIKNGITENLINLNSIVVSANEYPKYKFLIGKNCQIIGITKKNITDTFEESEFKNSDEFEKENFGSKIDSKEENQKDVLVEYTAKDIQKSPKPLKLKDKISNNIDANIENAKYGENGYGITFDGSSTYATIDSNKLNLSYPITITTAVKWENGNNNLLFIDAKSKIAIGTWNNELLLTVGSNYSYSYSLPTNFFKNDINYITVQYTSSTENTLYVNGEKMKHSSYSDRWVCNENEIYLGRRSSGSYFKGILYSFKIYNKLLTEEEILNNYNTEKTNFENKNFSNDFNSDNLVLKYICNSGENDEEDILDILKDNTNNKYNFSLNDVTYNSTKNGLVFNGSSSYGILKDDSLELNFPTTITIIAKCNKYGNNLLFTNKKSQIGIGLWESKYILLRNANSSVPYYNIEKNFDFNGINYITTVYQKDSGDSTLYLNGNKIETLTNSSGWNNNENGTYIGRRNSGSYFDGTLYKIKIYKKALSENEILEEYQKDKTYYDANN